jgi:hypothetical protein
VYLKILWLDNQLPVTSCVVSLLLVIEFHVFFHVCFESVDYKTEIILREFNKLTLLLVFEKIKVRLTKNHKPKFTKRTKIPM